MTFLLPITNVNDMARLVPMKEDELEAYAEAMFLQWTAGHKPKRARWADLFEYEKEKFRMCVRAVFGTVIDRAQSRKAA